MTEHNNNYSHLSSNKLVRNTVALVLAGGKGTRLKGLTKEIAKPAVSFGGKYKIIDFTLSNCINSGIRRVGVLTQFMAHDLIDHVQKGWGFMTNSTLDEGVAIIPAQQRVGESWYRGTADAVYQNLDLIRRRKCEQVLILGGDHIYKMDYSRMLNFHAESGADVTVACIKKPIEQASSFGVMSLDDNGRIVSFDEKPENPTPHPKDPSQALVSMGIYIFNADILDKELNDALLDPEYGHDFGHNIIPNLLERARVNGYVFTERHPGNNGYWRDVGDLDEYYAASMDLVAPDPELDLYDHSWPIITQQQQRPGAKFVFNDEDRKGFAVDSVLSAGTIISGAEVNHSLVATNCRIEDGTVVQDSIILPETVIGKNCRLTKVIVGENTIIPDGTVIGENLEEDSKLYEVTKGGVVLVTEASFQ
ncbi:glucose-1-phosphate adenylyltransferase [Vibrio breoganii]